MLEKKINALTATPLLGASLYRLLTTAVSVRYFLNKAFTAEVPKELVDYAVRTTRQPGARFAPFAFFIDAAVQCRCVEKSVWRADIAYVDTL